MMRYLHGSGVCTSQVPRWLPGRRQSSVVRNHVTACVLVLLPSAAARPGCVQEKVPGPPPNSLTLVITFISFAQSVPPPEIDAGRMRGERIRHKEYSGSRRVLAIWDYSRFPPVCRLPLRASRCDPALGIAHLCDISLLLAEVNDGQRILARPRQRPSMERFI